MMKGQSKLLPFEGDELACNFFIVVPELIEGPPPHPLPHTVSLLSSKGGGYTVVLEKTAPLPVSGLSMPMLTISR